VISSEPMMACLAGLHKFRFLNLIVFVLQYGLSVVGIVGNI